MNLINAKYGDDVDREHFTFIKVAQGYKGNAIPKFSIPVEHKAQYVEGDMSYFRAEDDDISEISMFSAGYDKSSGDNYLSRDSYGSMHDLNVGVIRRGSATHSIDNVSVTSENRHKKQVARKSLFGSTSDMGYTQGTIAGRNMLTNPMMLEYIKEESIETKAATDLKLQAVSEPAILLGWQVGVVLVSKCSLQHLHFVDLLAMDRSVAT